MSLVYVNQKSEVQYPKDPANYGAGSRYPEYIFDDISYKNDVYDMVRESFYKIGYDLEHYGTSQWNPLGRFIRPGQYVLIKPNLVSHQNHAKENGIECLITHPSLVRAVTDYVIIALKGTGRILIGDAPVQSCDFDKLLTDSGYAGLIDFYKKNKVTIDIADFRNYKTSSERGILVPKKSRFINQSIIVNLEKNSAFSECSDKQLQNLRITNYDPRVMQQHHNREKNEYLIAKEVLDADVIINMPKPKTHRKAGITVSLKNIVGINTNKEWLPHHTKGAKEEHGDEYLKKGWLSSLSSRLYDDKNMAVSEQRYFKARCLYYMGALCQYCAKRLTKDSNYSEGSWFGNDTLWRTIYDLNIILMYADRNGIICDAKQRQELIIGDMIISGEREGPLLPSPKNTGVIVVGEDPVSFDEVVCAIMGFDYKNIPSIYQARKYHNHKRTLTDDSSTIIQSNNPCWNNKKPDELDKETSLHLIPSDGWKKLLSNDERYQ